MLKLALELITLDTYLKEIRTFVKVESMKCFILTLESTIVIVTSMTLLVEYQFRKCKISMISMISSIHLEADQVLCLRSVLDSNYKYHAKGVIFDPGSLLLRTFGNYFFG